MSRQRRAAATLIAASLAVAGCSSADEAADENTHSPAPQPPTGSPEPAATEEPPELEVAWETGLNVVSGPRMAGAEVALVYVAQDRDLYLVAVDAESGEELWRQAASPGEVVTGIAVTPKVVDGHPVYLRPSDVDNLYAELVVADPKTGDDVVATEPLLFRSTPSACDDDDSAICLRVRESYDDSSTWRRLDLDGDGSLVQDEALEARTGRALGSQGLLDVREDDTEYLAVYDDGEELWRHPLSELFGADYSSDHGWGWRYDEQADLYVGSVWFEPEEDGELTILDLERSKVVAIERSTGEVAWTDEGVSHQCVSSLDVPTDEELEREAAGEAGSYFSVPVRCRMEGTVTFGGEDSPQHEGIDVTLEGFDPQTGETRWSLGVGETLSLLGPLGGNEPLSLADRTGVVVDVDGEPTVVDLVTGETRSANEETLWCSRPETGSFEYREPYYSDGEPLHDRYGEAAYEWCDSSGEAVGGSAPAPAEVPNGVGARAGDLTLVATPDGLVAYGRDV